MKQRHFIWFLLLSVGIYWFYLHQEGVSGSASAAATPAGKMAPDFALKDDTGRTVKLSDQKGKVVLVHFWATWCPPCASEFPAIDRLQATMPPDKFVLLAISEDEGGKKAIDAFRKKIPFAFPILFESENPVSDVYGTFRLPESYLIDKEGHLVKKFTGPQDWNDPAIQAEIKRLF